jgi:arylformamidase
MKIIDISQEVFSCAVFPGNPSPKHQWLRSMAAGERNNLSAFSMCAHNGTHVDAPSHFLRDGKTMEQLELDIFVGACFVARHEGDVTAEDAMVILEKAAGIPRILIAGDATVTAEAAELFANAGIKLLGNESQTVGPKTAPMQVHLILLGRGIALLEGVVLNDVAEGRYFLNAAPLNLGGCEGAPCRAYLIEGDIL